MLNKLSVTLKVNSGIIVSIAPLIALYYIGFTSYQLFHIMIELICIVIGFCIFLITKSTHKVSQNNYFIFLGTSFFIVSCIDLFHVLTYDNFKIFSFATKNVSAQLRMTARFMQSMSFLMFSILLYRKKKPIKLFYLLSSVYILSAAMIFGVYFQLSPVLYIDGVGLTYADKILEIVVCLIFLCTLVISHNKSNEIHETISNLLKLAITIMILSEISHIYWKETVDFIDVTGHILKFLSYYLIYKAIIKTTLDNPYNVLFYRLTEINSSLEIKTRQLMKINEKLNDEIYERKLIEEKLRNSKRSYQELLDFLPYAIVVHSDEKVVYVNNAALKLLKFNEYKEILGRDITDFVHPDYREKVHVTINTIEMKILRSDGKVIDVETKAVPYVYRNKESRLVVIGDLSERKKVEEKEKALNEAMEYDRIKNEFMANISHELRTPLNVIFGAIQLIDYYAEHNSLCDSKKSISKYSKSMKQNCYRMLRLVNNLIDLTKIDAGFLKLNVQNYNIISVVEDITLSVAEYIESKQINLQFDTEVEEKYIACDADMIERIILNLLSNAVKFTPKRGNIFVNVYDRDDYVLIRVKDSGSGIPDDKKEIIFDRFRQVDKSLARNAEGSGIGLNLVKSIVKLHGGKVWEEGTYGKGSEFIIKLPAVTVPYDEIAATNDRTQEKVERISIEFSDIYS